MWDLCPCHTHPEGWEPSYTELELKFCQVSSRRKLWKVIFMKPTDITTGFPSAQWCLQNCEWFYQIWICLYLGEDCFSLKICIWTNVVFTLLNCLIYWLNPINNVVPLLSFLSSLKCSMLVEEKLSIFLVAITFPLQEPLTTHLETSETSGMNCFLLLVINNANTSLQGVGRDAQKGSQK